MISEEKENPLDRVEKSTDIITLRQLLSGKHVFRVPDYQRGYAWNDEFLVLWQDIMRLYRTKNRKHYTGMLALEEITDLGSQENEAVIGMSPFYVVDGQQRITSLVIILESLKEYIRDEMPEYDLSTYDELLVSRNIYRFGYSYRRQDGAADYFEKRIFKGNTSLPHSDRYLANINAAKEYIDKELNRMSGGEALEIMEAILNRIVFNLYFVTDDFDVRVTFETINNRGKHLSKLELLKNRLMYLSTFFTADDYSQGLDLKKRINMAWKTIYENLCFGEDQLSDDEYLKAHWIVYKRLNKRKGDSFIDDLLGYEFAIDSGEFYGHIAKKDFDNAYKHINDYIDSLSNYSLYWAFVNKPEDVSIVISPDESEWIKRLSRISNSLFLRATLMVVVAENSIVWAEKELFYSKVELFIFTNKLLAQDSNDLSFLVTSAQTLLNEEKDKANKLREMIEKIENHDLRVDAKRIREAIESFRLNVLEKKANYYYDWNGLSYVLFEYNESLKIANAAPIQWYKLNSTSIEHVLPQTPSSEYWKTAFAKYDETEKKIIINSLGNLLLLSCGSENSSLKNFSFPVKKEMDVSSKKFAYCDGSRSAREIAEKEIWTINEISDRTDNLIKFIYDRWFAGKTNLTKPEWDSLSRILWNNLPSKMDAHEYLALKETLEGIDTSDERKKANKAAIMREPDYLQQQFMGYIDKDIMPIKYNSQRIYYKDWFTFKIISKEDIPYRLECGVDVEGNYCRIRYYYETNEIDVNIWNSESGKYLMSYDELPNKLKPFVNSLFRYLRKTFGKVAPIWKDRTN